MTEATQREVRHAMSSPSTALPNISALQWLRRTRALFTGVGYVAVFTDKRS
jgi:hypothetical protein